MKRKNDAATRREAADERSGLRTPLIYEIVRKRGDEEMERPAVSLWWSGVAAGLSISFSLLAQSILELHLPDAPWRTLVSSLGYAVGFLMVVLGRQQLFTENTLTAIIPLLARRNWFTLLRVARLWAVVLAANLVGAHLFAWVVGNEATIVLPRNATTASEIVLTAQSPVDNDRDRQTVTAILNGTMLAQTTIPAGWQEIRFTAPGSAWWIGFNQLHLVFSSTVSPAAMGTGMWRGMATR